MLSYKETSELLSSYGLPLVQGILVQQIEEAVDAFERIAASGGSNSNSACALKLISSSRTHKSEGGFVRLGLLDGDSVAEACREMLASLDQGESYEGFLVQPLIRSSRELILGAHIDAQFGPLVALGPGGILVDVLGGVDFLAAPFSLSEAQEFIGRNAALPLLGPVRGASAVHKGDLEACLVALGKLIAENTDRITSIDINPLVILPQNGSLVALDFRAEGGAL
ncbi:hypothetical protein MASR2M78_29840 [Treponema sp.]